MTMHILRGISGSGKTTFCKKNLSYCERISRDDIRAELTGSGTKFAGDAAFENKVSKIELERVRDLLIDRKDVVIDDTNLKDAYVRNWLNLANDYGTDAVVHEIQVTLEEAISRDGFRQLRGGYVGEDVIRRQYNQTLVTVQGLTTFSPVEPSPEHPFVDWSPVTPEPYQRIAYIFDIDGTLALNETGKSAYDHTHYPDDTPNWPVADMLQELSQTYVVLVVSGRGEEHREATEAWLRKYGVMGDGLFMRKAGDKRRDDVVKSEIFNEHIRDRYTVQGIFDDRLRTCLMWHVRGLPVFRVGDPRENF